MCHFFLQFSETKKIPFIFFFLFKMLVSDLCETKTFRFNRCFSFNELWQSLAVTTRLFVTFLNFPHHSVFLLVIPPCWRFWEPSILAALSMEITNEYFDFDAEQIFSLQMGPALCSRRGLECWRQSFWQSCQYVTLLWHCSKSSDKWQFMQVTGCLVPVTSSDMRHDGSRSVDSLKRNISNLGYN